MPAVDEHDPARSRELFVRQLIPTNGFLAREHYEVGFRVIGRETFFSSFKRHYADRLHRVRNRDIIRQARGTVGALVGWF